MANSDEKDDLRLPPLDEEALPELAEDSEDADNGLVVPVAATLDDAIPRLRELQVQLVKLSDSPTQPASENSEQTDEAQAESAVLLTDGEGISQKPAALSMWAYSLATLFNAERNARDVAVLFNTKYGQEITPEQVLELQRELDAGLFLYSRRFERALRRHVRLYLENTTRPAVHAGTAYPEDPALLMQAISGFFTGPEGPGDLNKIQPGEFSATDTVRGLILPHIDLRVGGATYAHGYRELIENSQAEIFVILGVAHQSLGNNLFYVSEKDFATPLGVVRTNRALAHRLRAASDADGQLAELAHRTEHSVEFQAVLLMALLARHCKRNVEIVPVLCGSVDALLEEDQSPLELPAFKSFTTRLGAELEASRKKWCVLCSVDFSHVGPEFGNSTMMTERLLLPVEREDRKVLSLIEKLDSQGLMQAIERTQNSRHMDAVLSVLTLLETCRGSFRQGKLLHYDQMLKTATHSAVSFASMAFTS